jgi:uncharacterized membrane protein
MVHHIRISAKNGKALVALAIALIISICAADSRAQVGIPFNQRDDQYRLLGLKRAKEAYEVARDEYERKKSMFDQKLISQLELDRSRNNFADSEVNYYQSLLAVLFEEQYVSVKQAVKYQTEDGRKRVRLRVENTSGGSAEFRKLVNIDDELFRSLQPDIINDVYVSLLNDENAIIGQPYEAKIEELRFGQPAELDFELLQDLDAVTVDIIYGSGSQRSPKIYLQKDASANKVIVQSQEFSQEVELGGSAGFGLTLELFSGVTNTFKLEVVNLPAQINRYFTDPDGQARLSQFKFTETTNTRRAALQVFLPDRPSEEISIDEAIPFYVLVIPREQAVKLGNMRDKNWTQAEIKKLDLGFVRLELVPRGIGKLLVRAPQLYHTIRADESVLVDIEVVNEGSRRLDNVRVEVDPPLNWQKVIDPQVISKLEIGEEKRVRIQVEPSPEVSVGRYEVRVRTSSLSDNQPVTGEDKSLTIEIQAEANILGITLIVLVIVGLVVGIVIFGIRLSRR